MRDVQDWIQVLNRKLLGEFKDRLLFTGLQGSYRRGEATDLSDIDVMVVLDRLEIADLQRYREIIAAMPESEKACGFICGREQLSGWPKYELFQLERETQSVYGNIAEILPPATPADIDDSIRIAAANLYHEVCHRYLYDREADRVKNLAFAYKSAFFLLKLLHYRRCGVYYLTKKQLFPHLFGTEQEILQINMDWQSGQGSGRNNPDRYFQLMISWTGDILAEMNRDPKSEYDCQHMY